MNAKSSRSRLPQQSAITNNRVCCTRRVPTVDGSAEVRVKPGTQSGDRLRMRNYGISHPDRSGKGDQYVVVKVRVPTPASLTKRQQELIKEFQEEEKKRQKQ